MMIINNIFGLVNNISGRNQTYTSSRAPDRSQNTIVIDSPINYDHLENPSQLTKNNEFRYRFKTNINFIITCIQLAL